ncbi:RsfA family transcriptional regulator [Paenibacillus illinoisensis]|uniref:RsfA family transcriptional regulator n=1 Tax=Paenibacillus illinoisensis TaxID=59845 RepID=A0A2W0CDV9_9BACL|nr:RsfA family transcriptional regulator [Paenibacillus illinoisensis]PYY28292.1 Uncharacterized protein PIL02S_03443 [Paenibacillus illinoisensis]
MNRKDNWSIEDDTLLADTILNYIRNGKTQLQAFENVGHILKRTPAACGFRWNSTVRHKFNQEIADAKSTKFSNRYSKIRTEEEVDIDGIIDHLLKLKNDLQSIESQKRVLTQKIQDVSLEINSRRSEQAYDARQNQEALLALLSKAADLGLFEQNKKPAI